MNEVQYGNSMINTTKKKPLFRGWNHLALAIINIPIVFFYLYSQTTNILQSIAVSLFYFSSTILYSMSSLLHLKYWSRKEYKFMKKIEYSGNLLSIYFNQLIVCLLALQQYTFFCLTLTFIASFVFPTCLREIVETPENHVHSYIKQCLIMIPFFVVIIFQQTYYANLCMFISFCSYLYGLRCYMTKKPVLWKNVFGYHEVFHLFTTISYICNVEYISEMLKN